ncbi:pilus assembly protein [Geomonas azotofigens]|uniref:pilus assembly protein n=1 Tax=Geomonas azotofigens TaxID=2843196 RepID=UPI001C129843|nr:pilus assembly protein PilY [Geomonas azotofigens]MBU5614772.1 pilus assembly protein PilY [Geomonas azotofigens]
MKKGRGLGGRVVLPVVISLLVLVLFPPPRQARAEDAAAAMQAYCSVPPLPGFGIKPNLLLLLDNSASMYDLAYTDPNIFCFDDRFDPSPEGNYPGYFDQGTLYRYSVETSAIGKFVPATDSIGASSCNQARSSHFCVNLDSSRKIDNFLATGKFLNWLAMSKLDLEKLALTGGKYDTVSGTLQGESRGCQGKRHVKTVYAEKTENGKIVNDLTKPLPVTFGVRGPIPSESGYVQQANHGGPSRIDVYPATYNRDDCLTAVNKWQGGTRDEIALYTAKCMGQLELGDGTPTAGKVFAEIMTYCYTYRAGTDIVYADIADTLVADCLRRYSSSYSDDPTKIVKNTGDDVCARGLFHNLITHEKTPSITGYLGQCYQTGDMDADCTVKQTKDFCSEVQMPWLADPSVGVTQAGTNASLPAYILDAGITSLGQVAGTLQVRVATAAAPTGLIQLFATEINLGAMVFNDNGAGSECGGVIPCVKHCKNDAPPRRECYVNGDCGSAGPCVEDTRNDGGRIISYINYSEVGDHGTGSSLVAAIDAIRGTSWTPLAEAFYDVIGYFANQDKLRLQQDDFNLANPPSKYSCQSNNVLILTDGMSTADRATAVNGYVAAAVAKWTGSDGIPASQTTTNGTAPDAAPSYLGSYNLDDLAWIARHKNIFDPDQPVSRRREYITTHVVYTGPPCGDPKTGTGYNPDGSCVSPDEGKPEKLMQLTAAKGGGAIENVRNPATLQSALKGLFQQVVGGSYTGTSSSILATGEGNGALFLQPQFYPNKSFDAGRTFAAWIGEMQSLWYYIDPFIGGSVGASSGIREDTGGGRELDLKQDRVVQFILDPALLEARARLFVDADGDGSIDAPQPSGYPRTVVPEAVQSLWRAGRKLWERAPSTRTIYTQTGGAFLVPFLDTTSAANQQLLQAKDQAEADQIVAFARGTDDSAGANGPATRTRTLTAYGATDKLVWKLGDIISSTPVLQSAVPLGSYHLAPPRGYADASYGTFSASDAYRKRGTVYVGANDGMLHAFRLGRLKVRPDGAESWPVSQKAALTTASGEEDLLGEEQWAFVPKNALPYLRYLKEPLYPHLYYVDGAITLVDAAIGDPQRCSRDDYWNCTKDPSGNSWRTVLIGGMGLGGASRLPGDACSDQDPSPTCVKAPAVGVGGLSSYFALDVTGQAEDGSGSAPTLLWEFSHPELGFATSGPAIVRIKARSTDANHVVIHDPNRNGRWFAVFASGPTGAVERKTRQFTGTSDQNLKLFVVDLNAVPPLVQGRNYWIIDTGIPKAFGGSMSGAGIDADKWNVAGGDAGNYEDDALYLGYTRAAAGGGWTGGVLRLLTGHDPDPSTWKTSPVIDDVGPVTGAVAKLQDRQYKRLWLYFGAGRYFNTQDDLSAGRALYGVSEPCYTPRDTIENGTCSKSPVLPGDLVEVTDVTRVVPAKDQTAGYKGWWIRLDAAAGNFGSERLIDSPSALTGGAVFLTTYQPPLDPCLEGFSYLWGVHYSTGGAVASLSAQVLIPLANGTLATVDAGSFPDRGKRRSAALTGKAVKPRLVTNSGLKPLKKIIHIQER